MRKAVSMLLSMIVVGFVGCGSTGNLPKEGENSDNIQSAIPSQSQGIGLDYDISDYFFPYNTLNDGAFYKNYTVTTQDANGYFSEQESIVRHYLEGNNNRVHIFDENDKQIQTSIIEANHIAVTTYDNQNRETRFNYSRILQVNEDLFRYEDNACVLRERLENLYISNIIPIQADPNSSPAQFGSVLHFYCGTSEGLKIDRYYAEGWGEIVEKYQYRDNSVNYVVFDMQTDQNP